MKHLYLFVLFCTILNTANSQTITPRQSTEFCPNTEYTFTATITKPFSSITGVGGCFITQTPATPVGSTFTFKGKFDDANQKQTFQVNHPDGSHTDFEFKKIKSLFYSAVSTAFPPCNVIVPNQVQPVLFPRCQVSSATISFPNIQWFTAFESPEICFGTVTDYEYQLPAGWSIGANASNGSNWIAGGNTVVVTSDLSNGDGADIKIRASNNTCGTTLTKNGPVSTVRISRPRPELSIVSGNGTDYICSGSVNYSLSGSLPSGATVSWSLNNSTYVSIPNPSVGTTVPVSFVSNGQAILTATITDCIETYPPISKTIVAGPSVSGFITAMANSYNTPGLKYNLTGGISLLLVPNDNATFISNITSSSLTNINWTWTGYPPNNPIIGNGGLGLTFTLPVAGTPWTQRTTSWQLTAQHVCGQVDLTIPYSVVSKGGFSFSVVTSPNPAANNLRLTFMDESNELKASANKEVAIKLYNLNSAIVVKQWQMLNDNQQIDLNVSNVKAGQYVIEVIRGNFKASKQIQIQ
jgi:hypothetical protein